MIDRVQKPTFMSDRVQFGHYILVLAEPHLLSNGDPSKYEATWVIEDGDAVMLTRLWCEEHQRYGWALWFACTEIPLGWCGSMYESDPQVAADHAWEMVEEMAAMYCGENGWL